MTRVFINRVKAARRFMQKRHIIGVILWLCWAILLVLAFSNMNSLAITYSTVSLRYDTPISHTASENARRYALAGDKSEVFWPTFWTEQEDIEVDGLHGTNARCIWFSGDASLVWPARFIVGGYPGPPEKSGCCISSGLAFRIWANESAVGSEIEVDGIPYKVRGVFREDDLLVIASIGEAVFTDGWQAVELSGTLNGDARSAALSFAQLSGLGVPATLVDGPAISAIASLLSALPLVVMGIAVISMLLLWLAKILHAKRGMIAFVVLALVLLAIFEILPTAFIPTRFSDFAFWSRLADTSWQQFEEWLLLHPAHIDLNAKLLLFLQTGIFIIQSIISVFLIRHSLLRKRGEHHS